MDHRDPSVSLEEITHNNDWLLSNENMARHVEALLVPEVISGEEWDRAELKDHSAGTMLEVSKKALFHHTPPHMYKRLLPRFLF